MADKFRQHSLTEDPESADLILFAEIANPGHYMSNILSHPLYRRHADKTFLCWGEDRIIPRVPGIYPSIEKRWHRRDRARSGCYLDALPNPYVEYRKLLPDAKYLYSFVGDATTHPVRQPLMDLPADRALLTDVSRDSLRLKMSHPGEEKHRFWRQFAETIGETKFPLCPRGVGCSSIRLFESMKMGRAPVIISDDWVPVEGPEWNTFSFRVAEKDVAGIPALLQANEDRAVEMGDAARREWENWFSPAVLFHQSVETCLDIARLRRWPETIERRIAELQLLEPFHTKAFLRPYLKR